MNAKYTINENCRLEIFLWSDVMEGKTYREFIEVTPIYGDKRGRKCNKRLQKDEIGIYIIWNDNKIYLDQFNYMPLEVLISKINEGKEKNDRWFVWDDDILATFLKETNKIGVVLDMQAYDMVCPQLGIGFVGEREYSVLCVPTEKQYDKNSWHYKFTLECECEELRKYIPYRHFYFSDFCSLVKSGHVNIVVKEDFKKNMIEKYKEQEKEEKKFSNKVAKFFGKKKEKEQLTLIGV